HGDRVEVPLTRMRRREDRKQRRRIGGSGSAERACLRLPAHAMHYGPCHSAPVAAASISRHEQATSTAELWPLPCADVRTPRARAPRRRVGTATARSAPSARVSKGRHDLHSRRRSPPPEAALAARADIADDATSCPEAASCHAGVSETTGAAWKT